MVPRQPGIGCAAVVVEYACPDRDFRGVPHHDVLVERGEAVEHVTHVRDLGCVPACDILIERIGVLEHGAHGRDARGIPFADILVERVGAAEHILHVRDRADVPRTDVLIERVGIVEHPVHARDRADVPSRYIRVEGCFDLEQLAHARHQRHVPVGHLDRSRGAAVRAMVATRHAGGIDAEAVVHRGLQRSTVGKRAPGVAGCGIISGGVGPAAGAGRAHSVLDAFVLEASGQDPITGRSIRRVEPVAASGEREPGVCAREHPRRVGVVGEGPTRNVPVEAGGALKHTRCGCHLRHLPLADVLVEA